MSAGQYEDAEESHPLSKLNLADPPQIPSQDLKDLTAPREPGVGYLDDDAASKEATAGVAEEEDDYHDDDEEYDEFDEEDELEKALEHGMDEINDQDWDSIAGGQYFTHQNINIRVERDSKDFAIRRGRSVKTQRLLGVACGSPTFLPSESGAAGAGNGTKTVEILKLIRVDFAQISQSDTTECDSS